jgi:hypothetical protein
MKVIMRAEGHLCKISIELFFFFLILLFGALQKAPNIKHCNLKINNHIQDSVQRQCSDQYAAGKAELC